MKKQRVWLLLCTLIPLLTMQACDTQPSFEQQPQSRPGWTTYTNGNYVITMAFDHKGNLWAGGCGGIVKWNLVEQTYERYTALDGLANNEVHSIAVASDDTIWVGTGQGLSYFNGQDWATYDLSDGSVFRDVYSAIVDSFGEVWAASNTGLYRFDGETWLNADAVNSPNSVVQAPDGALWVGDWDGISRFDGESWTEYVIDDIFPDDSVAVDSVRVLAVAPDGSVWGTAQNSAPGQGQEGIGVFQFDGQSWMTYTIADGLADNTVYAAIITPDSNVWFATDAGVSRFDGENWATFDKDDGLASNSVRSIVEGPDGKLLFGTQGFGISRFDGRTWAVYQTDDYLGPSSANAIAIDTGGSLWLGTDEGVYHFDDGTWINYTQKDGLSSDKVTSIALASDGALWVTSANCCILCSPPRGGLSRFDGQNWTTYVEAGECRYSVNVDDNNAVWFTGLYQYLRQNRAFVV